MGTFDHVDSSFGKLGHVWFEWQLHQLRRKKSFDSQGGGGGWRSMDAKRVTAATARRRLEDSEQSACQTKPSSGRVYDGAPGGPALLSPCLSDQRAESSTTIRCTVTWNCEWELRTNKRNKKSFLRISPSLEFDFGLCV